MRNIFSSKKQLLKMQLPNIGARVALPQLVDSTLLDQLLATDLSFHPTNQLVDRCQWTRSGHLATCSGGATATALHRPATQKTSAKKQLYKINGQLCSQTCRSARQLLPVSPLANKRVFPVALSRHPQVCRELFLYWPNKTSSSFVAKQTSCMLLASKLSNRTLGLGSPRRQRVATRLQTKSVETSGCRQVVVEKHTQRWFLCWTVNYIAPLSECL